MNMRSSAQAPRAHSAFSAPSSPSQTSPAEISRSGGRKWENLTQFKARDHYLDKNLNLHSRRGLIGVINAVRHFFGAFSLSDAISGLRAVMVIDPKRFQENRELQKLHTRVSYAHGNYSPTAKALKALFSNVHGHSVIGRIEVAYQLNTGQRQLLSKESTAATPEHLIKVVVDMQQVEKYAKKELIDYGLPPSYSQHFLNNSKAIVSAAANSGIPLKTYIKGAVIHLKRSMEVPNINSYLKGYTISAAGTPLRNLPKSYRGAMDAVFKSCHAENKKNTSRTVQPLSYSQRKGGKIYGVTCM